MTSIHGVVPRALREVVREAQMRGQETVREEVLSKTAVEMPAAPVRRRRPTARQRGTTAQRRSDGSPSAGMARRRHQPEQDNPFIVQTRNDDVFGSSIPDRQERNVSNDDDSSILIDADQENDEARSPKKAQTPKARGTPKRPPGAPVPLGELTLEEPSSSEVEDSMEMEYPPSPKKSSPLKSPAKRRPQPRPVTSQAESSRDAAARNITPANNPFAQPLAHDSPYTLDNPSLSPRKKTRMLQETPKRAPLFGAQSTPREGQGGIFKTKSPSSTEKKARERRKREELERKLWRMCGGDVERWNRGDFAGQPFGCKARRW